MFDDRVKQNCVDCRKPILVEKKVGRLTNVCDDCARGYAERFGVRRPVKRKPKRGNA